MCSISIRGVAMREAVLADEDVEEDPDRWCSYTECGQELWQIACQWVWNLRLCLGQTMQGVPVREIEWAPPKEAPTAFAAKDPPPEGGWDIVGGHIESGESPEEAARREAYEYDAQNQG
jgi:NUDIX domain